MGYDRNGDDRAPDAGRWRRSEPDDDVQHGEPVLAGAPRALAGGTVFGCALRDVPGALALNAVVLALHLDRSFALAIGGIVTLIP